MFRRVLLAAVLSAAFVSAASAATVSYTAHLSGRSEVPKTDSKGKGKLDATFDTQSRIFTYTLTFDGLSGPATAAHIHGPANRAQTAGVVAPLGDKNPTSPVSGTVTLTDDQVKMLRSAQAVCERAYGGQPGRRNPRPDYRAPCQEKAMPAAATAPAPAASMPAEGAAPK